MKIWKNFKSIGITTCLLPLAILLNYMIDDIIIKKIIVIIYTSALFLESLYIAYKNRPLSRKDKVMLIVICLSSIFMFTYSILYM